jgi:hypothetical protein
MWRLVLREEKKDKVGELHAHRRNRTPATFRDHPAMCKLRKGIYH